MTREHIVTSDLRDKSARFWRFLKNIISNVQEELEVAVDKGNVGKVKALLSAGADPNARFGLHQTTFLHRARSVEIIRALLAHGADINAKDLYECTPLYYSVIKESAAIVRELLKSGADVNAADDDGDTALCLALSDSPKLEVIAELLEHGANICVADAQEYMSCYFTSSSAAFKSLQLPVAKLLIKFTLLQYFAEDYKNILDLDTYRECDNYNLLASYRDECVAEIVQMMADMINNDFSIHGYLMSRPRNVKSYSGNKSMEGDIMTKYPIYRDVILPSVKSCLERSALLDKFTRLHIYERLVEDGRIKETTLSYDCLCVIAEYLSNEELFNFVSCFEITSDSANSSEMCTKLSKQCEVRLHVMQCTVL